MSEEREASDRKLDADAWQQNWFGNRSKEREVSDHKLDAELRARIAVGFTRYVPAPMLLMGPIEGVITHGEILGVWVHPDETVKWLWNSDDTVYGYEIVKLP